MREQGPEHWSGVQFGSSMGDTEKLQGVQVPMLRLRNPASTLREPQNPEQSGSTVTSAFKADKEGTGWDGEGYGGMTDSKGTLKVSGEYRGLRPANKWGTDDRQTNEKNTLHARHQCSGSADRERDRNGHSKEGETALRK